MVDITQFQKKISAIFQQTSDRRTAHKNAATVLKEMAANNDVLFSILLTAMRSPNFFSRKRINPVIGIPVFETPDCTLIAHIWIPRPDSSTTLSHQSIHHHGNLLLTSVAAYGSGYESILFKNNYKITDQGLVTGLEIEKIYKNTCGSLDFVDSYAPHIVFYPEEISVTYALWSNHKAQHGSRIKSLPFVKKYKAQILSILKAFGIAKSIGINVVENFDFHVENGLIYSLKERIRYPEGTNENFLNAFFWALQKLKFPYLSEIRNIPLSKDEEQKLSTYLATLESSNTFLNIFEESHKNIPKVTLQKNQVLACFPNS